MSHEKAVDPPPRGGPLRVVEPSRPKSGRTRFVRYFPERVLFMLDQLTAKEFVAMARLAMAYVIADGDLPADDRRLASITKLSAKAWTELRDKALLLGLGRIERGQWIDDDQLGNLLVQRRTSERGKRGAAGRWGDRGAA